MAKQRSAIVSVSAPSAVEAMHLVDVYLPSNYTVVDCVRDHESKRNLHKVTVRGSDIAGWTLHEYVLPRLASALLVAHEVIPSSLISEYDEPRPCAACRHPAGAHDNIDAGNVNCITDPWEREICPCPGYEEGA